MLIENAWYGMVWYGPETLYREKNYIELPISSYLKGTVDLQRCLPELLFSRAVLKKITVNYISL